jgi:Asp-tRNA(Asn)/Glu-tRNA(Gln) amidotransferase A subunit family amidase
LLRQFLNSLESGEKTAQDLLVLCLRRIATGEPDVRAWVAVAVQPGMDESGEGPGPLRGIPFGAKDILETRGLCTQYGSPLYEGRKGDSDAHAIGTLRRAGAVLLGKTHTTAFASFDPAPTRNPRFPGHSPGGSSSGSAAAVAAGMVPFAVGTQTLGSVLRPASFCGICGFKPSFGLIPTEGVLPFAPSFDTVGLFTQTADDMACLWPRSFGSRFQAELSRAARLAVAASEPMERAVGDAVNRLRAAGVPVDDLDQPAGWEDLRTAARTINQYEGARTHRARFEQFGERMGRQLAELIRMGLAIPEAEYQAARTHVEGMRTEVSSLFREYPILLTAAAAGPAPPIELGSTGDPSHNAPWTAIGTPVITVPLPVTDGPLGLQIAAACGRDDALVQLAAQLETLVG